MSTSVGGESQSRLAQLPARHGLALRRAAAGLLALVLLLGAGALIARTSLFSVDTVEVTGSGALVSQQAVLDAAGLRTGLPLVSVEENAIASRIEAIPGVANAKVSTNWPDKVTIEVTERVPSMVARTGDNRWSTISADGVVISVSERPDANLPAIVGTTVSSNPGDPVDDATKSVLSVASTLPQSLRPEVVQIQKDQEHGVRLGLRSGVIVILGSDDLLADKLTAAASVLRQSDQTKIASLDVQSPSLPVTNPKESSPAKSQPTQSEQPSTSTSRTAEETQKQRTFGGQNKVEG